jgi:Beta/Gamma crystallin
MKKEFTFAKKGGLLLLLLGTVFVAQAQVRFYNDPLYRGKSASFGASDYNTMGLGMAGNISSVQVPRGYAVVLFDRPNFRGNTLRLAQSTGSLADFGWDNRVQSMQVMQTGQPVGPIPVTRPLPSQRVN